MNIEQVKAEIVKMPEFKDFKWHDKSDNESLSAFLQVAPRNFRDEHSKDQWKLEGHYHLFIAHMYAGQKGKEFFYLIVYRKGEVKPYRCRNVHTIEYNKIYASGNTVKKIIKSLRGYFTKMDYTFK